MENQTLTLAPAAGAGIGKELAEKLLADPGFVPLMQKTAIDCLNAFAPARWDKGANDGKGGWTRDPDMRTRAQMFFGLLAHMEGEPVKRIIHQHLGGAGTVDPLGALRDSEALRDAAKAMLEKAEWRTSGRKTYKTPKQVEPAKPDIVP